MTKHIGFVSTRLAGTDGVSLETMKWVTVLERLGHTCFYFAGQVDWPTERGRVVPEAFFGHHAVDEITHVSFSDDWYRQVAETRGNPEIYAIYTQAVSRQTRPRLVTQRIHELREYLKQQLYAFVRDFHIELLIVENALAIPMNIPLGLALTEFIAETGLPTIAHHHDFYWERERFLVNCVQDYLNATFPPDLPSVRHVVINSIAAHELGRRTGSTAMVVPNVMDFDQPPPPPDAYTRELRADLGVQPDEKFFLQPTRVVQRKGIEHAIELTHRIGLKARLVISHASGDEGDAYEWRVREYAGLLNVPVTFEAELIGNERSCTPDGRKVYRLADAYQYADLITYPSSLEGFGNAFLEAVYYRRPIVVNSYSTYEVDIKPRGFRVIEFDGYITEATVQQTRQVLEDPGLAESWAEQNYRLAQQYFSLTMLQRRLQTLLADCFGETYE
ncbi:MAG TPA: glycosyltransferase family 4 protein [Anaerolineae bacterium]|nr:glycosyltransferase family 4 protein [Anaerolineae bacterium]